MPNRLRRVHTKSRFGCQQCKQRRIKCDLSHPSCGHCVKKNDACSFLLLVPSTRHTVTSCTSITIPLGTQSAPPVEYLHAVGSSHRTAVAACRRDSDCPEGQISALFDGRTGTSRCSPERNLTSKPQPSRVSVQPYLLIHDPWKDIRNALPSSLQGLLYHWDITTSLTIENSDLATAVWQHVVPQLAANHDFLVHCVLSISSLHIGHLSRAKDQPKQMRYWNAVAASRMNRALSDYRPGIESVTQHNVAALFASAAITAVYLFQTSAMDFADSTDGLPFCGAHATEVARRMMSSVVKPMWGLRGPLQVLMGGWNWLINGEMRPVATRQWGPKMRKPASPCARDEDERLRLLENLWMQTDRQHDPHIYHLSQALDLLRETYALVSQLLVLEAGKAPNVSGVPVDRAAIFSWVTRVSREYIQLVEAQDRDALVILAHFAVLLVRIDTVWWLEGLGSNFVTAIAMALGPEHRKLIDWPVRLAGIDLAIFVS